MSGTSFYVGGIQSSALEGSDALKSGPTPRDVEVLERWHRDRVHAQRGDPNQAHQVDRSEGADREPIEVYSQEKKTIMDVVA